MDRMYGSSKKKINIKKIENTLGELKTNGNLLGVLFSTREGNLISKVVDQDFEATEFIAMTASVIDSAEDLMNTISEEKLGKIITELDNLSILILGCKDNTFLVIIIGKNSKVEEILDDIDNYINKIMEAF